MVFFKAMSKTLNAAMIIIALAVAVHVARASDEKQLKGRASGATQTKEIELPATTSSTRVQLRLEANIKSGEAIWTLLDPTGKSRLTGQVGKGNITLDSGELETIAGTWTLRAEFRNATLDYDIRWRTR
jgi:hypothetical protein